MLLLAGVATFAVSPLLAAEVTPDRLANADKEPQNWLMNHRTYDAQRFSPLAHINKDNIKGLKLAYAVAIGGTSANENLQATPLAEDGYLYVVDQWGVVYKIDGRSGDAGRIVWRMDPGQEKLPLSNRALGQSRNLERELSATHHRHRQEQRQGRLGDEPGRRAGRPAAHRGPSCR
jgi:alcohol dehydrogenase (cytochrome c)